MTELTVIANKEFLVGGVVGDFYVELVVGDKIQLVKYFVTDIHGELFDIRTQYSILRFTLDEIREFVDEKDLLVAMLRSK